MKLWPVLFCMLFSCSLNAEAREETSAPTTQLPAYYPDSFTYRGTIEAIGVADGLTAITVDGTRYGLTSGVLVHFLSQRKGPILKLKPGMGIGFRLIENRNGRRLAEIWELPAALSPPAS